jgi:hypothetical protein
VLHLETQYQQLTGAKYMVRTDNASFGISYVLQLCSMIIAPRPSSLVLGLQFSVLPRSVSSAAPLASVAASLMAELKPSTVEPALSPAV